MARTPLIAGNWKMYLDIAESAELAAAIAAGSNDTADREIMLAPTAPALAAVAQTLSESRVLLGSQNICWEEQGAFTDETSPQILKNLGGSMAIIGHSERRHIFGESNTIVNQRLLGAVKFGIIPILCVGETLEEREQGATLSVLEEQIRQGMDNLGSEQAVGIVIAYEPVWAIGTGKTATTEQAQDAHYFIRGLLAKMYEKTLADNVRILYGGSVKPDNIDALMAEADIDGALVGGASLKAESFLRIIHFTA